MVLGWRRSSLLFKVIDSIVKHVRSPGFQKDSVRECREIIQLLIASEIAGLFNFGFSRGWKAALGWAFLPFPSQMNRCFETASDLTLPEMKSTHPYILSRASATVCFSSDSVSVLRQQRDISVSGKPKE